MFLYGFLFLLTDEERSCAERIFEQHRDLIYMTAYKILNLREDAEDTLNEVMINVMNNIKKFMGVGRNDIESQLVIYTRNAAINLYKRNKLRVKFLHSCTYINENDDLDEVEHEDLLDVSLDEIILERETVEIVRGYVKQLPEEYQDIIKLVYGLGYTNVEAGRVLNLTPNAVGLRLFRAKKKLLKMAGGALYERIHEE